MPHQLDLFHNQPADVKDRTGLGIAGLEYVPELLSVLNKTDFSTRLISSRGATT